MGLKALSLWALQWLLAFGYAASYEDFAFPIDHSLVHNYSRLTEIKKHCSPFTSSASELESEDNWASRLKNELSFFNGDWEQDSRGAPLMPFDDSDIPGARSWFISPWKVVSFEVKNVSSDASHQPNNTISISGVLSIGITRNSTVISEPGLKFHKRPGMSALRVDFEGLYLKRKGESLVCLLGNSTFPFKKVPTRFSDDDDMTSYYNVRDTYNEEHVILPHDKILLVLKYLKTRIHGEMTSLNQKEDFEYFDKVHISSHLGIIPKNHLKTSEDLISESFDQNPLQDAMAEDGVNKFNNSEFCKILKFFEHKPYRVMPNLKLGGQNGYQDTVGPFLLGNEIQLVDRNNNNLRVLFHNIRCKEEKVSGVLRMYPATIEPHVAASRTGLSSLTLSVNGAWSSSNGILSMTGCLGPTLLKCDTGVLLYFPKSFSSKQRSAVSGSIFSLKNETVLYHPVFIGLEMLSPGLHDSSWYSSAYLTYNYSKNALVIEFRERIQEPWLLAYIRKSLFRYPEPEEEKDGTFKITNRLLDDLSIYTFSSTETFVRVEILSLGGSFRTNDSHFHEVSEHEILNISMNLFLVEAPRKVKEESYRHVSKLYLEGLYDPRVGKLYLIGCRKVDYDQVDLERGLDCSIEVTIEYSPVNTRWLINPTARVTIASQRNEDDNYHFKTVRLQTFMIHDKNHEKDVIFREIFEGYLQVLLLLMIVAHIMNQMKNMRKSPEQVAHISLGMLGLWIVGYGITVINGKELLVMSSESQIYKNRPYNHQSYKRHLNILDYFARFLVLVSMFLMAGISQMVWKARKALQDQGESTLSEKKVLLVSFGVYMCYIFFILVDGGLWLYQNPLQGASMTIVLYMKLVMEELRYEVYKLKSYSMLPQIVAIYIWKRPRPRVPLLGSFLTGLVIPSVVQLIYEIVRDPVDYPLFTHDDVL